MYFANGDTVTVLRRPPLPNGRHNDRVGDAAPYVVHHSISGVAIEWGGGDSRIASSVESDPSTRGSVLSDVVLHCPPGSDIRATDKVRLPDGDDYFVVGKPARPRSSFTGWEPAVTVQLKGVL